MLKLLEPDFVITFPETSLYGSCDSPAEAVKLAMGPPTSVKEHALSIDFRDYPDDPISFMGEPDAPGVHQSTGGSTGIPKACVRSFLIWTSQVVGKRFPIKRHLINGAFCSLGQWHLDRTLVDGGTAVLTHEAQDPEGTLGLIESEGITHASFSTTRFIEWMYAAEKSKYDISTIERISRGGENLQPTMERRIFAKFGPVFAFGYGTTETGMLAASTFSEDTRDGQLFRSSPGNTVRCRSFSGPPAAPDTVGMLAVHPPAGMIQYHNTAVKTRPLEGGWYVTGDIGYIRPDGSFRILGRSEDVLILSNSDAVTPEDTLSNLHISEILLKTEGVKFAYVMRDEDKHRWVAGVQSVKGTTVDLEACEELVRRIYPIDHIVFVRLGDKLVQTMGGKFNRAHLMELIK